MALCNWTFIILYHLHTTKHLSQAIYIQKNADAINYAYDIAMDPEAYVGVLSGD